MPHPNRRIPFQKNPHVAQLFNCEEEQKVQWCARVLNDLLDHHHLTWDYIKEVTGRTRQTWNNVSQGKTNVVNAFIYSATYHLKLSGFEVDTTGFLEGKDGPIVTRLKKGATVDTSEVIVRCARLVREGKMSNAQLLSLIDNL